MTASRLLSVWLPVVLWAGLIFGLSSIPSLDSGLGTWDLVLRKIAHAAEYAVLGFLLLRALGRELPAAAAGIAYAVTDEIHQSFVAGRHGAAYDVAVDTAGVLVGVFVLRRLLAHVPGASPARKASERREGQYSTYGQAPRAPHPAAGEARAPRSPASPGASGDRPGT